MEKDLPKKLYYNQDYSWVKIEDDIATLGIVKPAADKVKEFVFIKLPEVGKTIKKGDVYASLEAVKWTGHLSSPLSGKVESVNEEVFDEPSIINEDAYEKGWIAKIKISTPGEKNELLSAKEVQPWLEEEVENN